MVVTLAPSICQTKTVQAVAVLDQRRHSASEDARGRAYGSTSLRAAPRPGHVGSSFRLRHRGGELDEEVVGGLLCGAVDETLAELGELAADLRLHVIGE